MKFFSWFLIVVGLIISGRGAYEYYLAQRGQVEAQTGWTEEQAEEPVPASTQSHYFDPYKLGDTVAKLRVPRLGRDLYVVEGTDQTDLQKGPGHMPGTALPGVLGNCVIAGHRDTHFRVLQYVKRGDEIELDARYGKFLYKVRSIDVVWPTNVTSLRPTNAAVLHLITCYPFNYIGHAPQRMVIEADLLGPANGSKAALQGSQIFAQLHPPR